MSNVPEMTNPVTASKKLSIIDKVQIWHQGIILDDDET